MKKAAFLFLLFVAGLCRAQQGYWQQQLSYRIDVQLNDSTKSLNGFEQLVYTNHSPDTLFYIWFHLWPNAYKNDRTTLSEDLIRRGNTAFYFSKKEEKGYVNRLQFSVNDKLAQTQDHPQYIDVVKLLLPQPLAPGGSVQIKTPFHVQLPYNFSRSGWADGHFAATQWYPKPAVYDAAGWHPMPYVDQGEFYAEFASFDVRITAPADYAVAATGRLLNDEVLNPWLNKKATVPNAAIKSSYKKPAAFNKNAGPTTWHFQQDSVHDFAFFAHKKYIVEKDTCLLPDGRVIDAIVYYTAAQKMAWKKSLGYLKNAVRFYSSEVGPYAYGVVQAVQGANSFGGGMEYPTITVISPVSSAQELDVVIAHEVGHNWFQGMLASNEREHPWMDEGLNSYYERAYVRQYYGVVMNTEEALLRTLMQQQRDQAINTSSSAFIKENYGLVAYYKTARWLETIRDSIGAEKFNAAMRNYFQQWKFKHPQPQHLLTALRNAEASESLLNAINNFGNIAPHKNEKTKITTLLPLKNFKAAIASPAYKNIFIGPAIGYNNYNKLMLGLFATNYNLPPAKINWFVAPVYATGTQTAAGLGRVAYNRFLTGSIQQITAGITAASFAYASFTTDKGDTYYPAVKKLAPSLTLFLKEASLQSTRQRYLQWKSFFIAEQPLRITNDTSIINGDTSINLAVKKVNLNYTVHQVEVGISDSRSLYPYKAVLQLQANTYFFRLSTTINYFFNYRDGGIALRFFAGKFMYNNSSRIVPYGFNINRFFLNLSAVNGEEDYTYSNYFVGRNDFEGRASQQVLIRDGGLRFRTDLLANKVGKTDDWLAAINLTASVPETYNPLSVLPVKIPLQLFADIGTNREGWDRRSNSDRLLFVSGLAVPLLKGAVNVYLPLVYSRVYRDYYKSYLSNKRFLQSISFSIQPDLQPIKKLVPAVFF